MADFGSTALLRKRDRAGCVKLKLRANWSGHAILRAEALQDQWLQALLPEREL
jgi:hypothetical protein